MLGGLLLGGLIGGLLFGHAGFGVGLLDLLLIGGGVMLLVAMLRRRQQSPQLAMAGAGTESSSGWNMAPPAATAEAPSGEVERGVDHIRAMDPTFDPDALAVAARGIFSEVQKAVSTRDVTPVRDKLAPEMAEVLQTQCGRLRGARQTNRIEQIDMRRSEVSEVWQESGRDFATVYLSGTLLDYTVDDTTGGVIDGSRTAPQEFEEYWTFTRAVGPNPWKLSAIQTG
jgi:predicted lipid-binding transport protein (Tim44 family)